MTLQAYKKRILEYLNIEYEHFNKEQGKSLRYTILNQEIEKLYKEKIPLQESIIKVLSKANREVITMIQQMVHIQASM